MSANWSTTFEGDTDWMEDAACRGQVSTEVFFPSRGEAVDVPRSFCRRCPVREECLDYALRNRVDYGIWGGESERSRRRLRRGRMWCAHCRREVARIGKTQRFCSDECRKRATPHGALRYRYGCRCGVCTEANRTQVAVARDREAS